MSLPQFSIKRPITTIMIILGVVLFGFISLSRLPQELFPPITYPQLTVATVYANAAPEEIETLITKPIEEAVGTVSGLRRIRSISREGISLVMAEFGWNENMDFAALRVREKIDLIKERLPRDSGEPLVMKYNPFELPVMTLSITGRRSPAEIREITRRIIKDELEKIEGVASASISGGLEREILVKLDQARLYAQGVPIMDVVHAITNANLNYPAGTIKESFYEYLIRTLGEFQEVDEISMIPVKKFDNERLAYLPEEEKDKGVSEDSKMVLLKDVADVHDTYKERTSHSRYNGKENVAVSVQKQAQSNTLQVVNRVKKTLKEIKEELPSDIDISIVYDQSTFIKDSINGVRDAAVQGGILAFIVLYIFLRSFRSSVIVTFSIPISIMAVFVLMYIGGISINMMSLGGLALGVGMLVDNAIVVLENIVRHRNQGEDSFTASSLGAAEVSNAITASTLTTIAVFLPMVFVVGIAGQLFKELAFTVTFALVASLLVALSLVPLLASRVKNIRMSGNSKEFENKVLKKYETVLKDFIKNKKQGFYLMLLLFVFAGLVYLQLDKELMPKMDQGQFIVKVGLKSGTRLEITNNVVTTVERYLIEVPEVEETTVVIGSSRGKEAEDVMQRLGAHEAEILVNLKDKRRISTKDLVQRIKNRIDGMKLKNARIDFVLQESIFSSVLEESTPIVVEIKGKELPVMLDIMEKVKEDLEKIKGIYGIKTDMPEPSPETRITVNKDKAATYNFSVVDVAQTLQASIRGYIASQYKDQGREIDIRVRLRDEDIVDVKSLERIQLTSPTGAKVSLSNLVKFSTGKGPSQIKRQDQERAILVSANLFKRPLKDAISEIEKKISKLKIPEDYKVRLTGESEEMKQSFNSLRNALFMSILLVYMIMAAQFESMWQPFIIMFTVPLSLIGVVVALYVTHTSVNVVALLGVIMLGGIVVNNGIVLIDYINVLLSKGMSPYDAVIEASKARLRPILMTAMTTILGLVPMALAIGEGAELRAPMAISVIGGLFFTTFLSLLFIPAIYLTTHNFRDKIKKKA